MGKLRGTFGKIEHFGIDLYGDNSVYFSGSDLEGSVILELSQHPRKAQSVSITLTGVARVHWTEERTTETQRNRRRTETIHYSNDENILGFNVINLWGNGQDIQEIAVGKHEFPFKFQLPPDQSLPTSFESQNGYIRYSLVARIDRTNIDQDHDFAVKVITVGEVVDNNTAELASPRSNSNEKMLCCLCCTSGPISLSVKTDRDGYCPGESIAISTEVENYSNRRINGVRATLKQKVVYDAKGDRLVDYRSDRRTNNKVIQQIESPGIQSNGSFNWSNELLPIPATVPTINNCRILNLSYILTVTLDIPWAIDLSVEMPITIVSVPFPGDPNAYPDLYPPLGLPGENISYSAIHPPVNIDVEEGTMGETQYAPVYAFVTNYQFAPSSSYAEPTVKVKGGKD